MERRATALSRVPLGTKPSPSGKHLPQPGLCTPSEPHGQGRSANVELWSLGTRPSWAEQWRAFVGQTDWVQHAGLGVLDKFILASSIPLFASVFHMQDTVERPLLSPTLIWPFCGRARCPPGVCRPGGLAQAAPRQSCSFAHVAAGPFSLPTSVRCFKQEKIRKESKNRAEFRPGFVCCLFL